MLRACRLLPVVYWPWGFKAKLTNQKGMKRMVGNIFTYFDWFRIRRERTRTKDSEWKSHSVSFVKRVVRFWIENFELGAWWCFRFAGRRLLTSGCIRKDLLVIFTSLSSRVFDEFFYKFFCKNRFQWNLKISKTAKWIYRLLNWGSEFENRTCLVKLAARWFE